MIHVTKQAKQELQRLLPSEEDVQKSYLRIIDRGQGELGIITDSIRPDDEIVEYDGRILLVADPRLNTNLRGITLDAYLTMDVSRLVISEEVVSKSSTIVTISWIPAPQPCCHPN